MSEARIRSAWWVDAAIQDTATSVFAVTAGLGSGKTHGMVEWHHDRVRKNRGAQFSAVMEPTYQKVLDTAIPKYQKFLESIGRLHGYDYKIVTSPFPKLIYLDQARHEVHFLSAERPDTIAGVEYSHASEDEAGVNNVESRRNLRGRLNRDPNARVSQFMCVGAPQGINAFAEEFDSQTLPGWDLSVYRDHTKTELIEGIEISKRRFILWTDDNPFVKPQYLAELQSTYGHNPNLIRSYRYGEFCPLVEGAAVPNYFPQKHDVTDMEPDPYLDIVLTWDFNANPVTWVAIQKVAFLELGVRVHRYVAIHETELRPNNLDEAVAEFVVKHPVARFTNTRIRIFGDSSGHAKSNKVEGSDYENIEQLLRKWGYRNVEVCAFRSNPSESASIEAVQRLFLHNLLLLCRRMKGLRASIMNTRWKEGTRKLDKPSGETHTHKLDSVKYWAWQETRKETSANTKIITGVNY